MTHYQKKESFLLLVDEAIEANLGLAIISAKKLQYDVVSPGP